MNEMQMNGSSMSSGNMIEWKNAVENHVLSSTMATLFMSAGLSSLLLERIPGADNFVLHIYGESSSGKTMALRTAASAWGKPSALLETWRAMTQGVRQKMEDKNNATFFLDESGMVTESDQAEFLYALGNGASDPKQPSRFNLVALSTGEKKLSGKSPRTIQMQANAFGVLWPTVKNAEAADTLCGTLESNYGHAVNDMRKGILEMTSKDSDALNKIFKEYAEIFHKMALPVEEARQARIIALCLTALNVFLRKVMGWPEEMITVKMKSFLKATMDGLLLQSHKSVEISA